MNAAGGGGGGATTTNGATGGHDADNANRVTYDEFAILVRRIDRMEYSIGNIVSRVNRFHFSLKTNNFDLILNRSMVF